MQGFPNHEHLNENLKAVNVRLTAENFAELDADFAKLTVHGDRMNETQRKTVE